MIEEILVRVNSTYQYFKEDRKEIPKSFPFFPRPGVIMNPQLLKLPMSRTNFLSPKNVQSIKVRLYS